jgi:hypothetical protein
MARIIADASALLNCARPDVVAGTLRVPYRNNQISLLCALAATAHAVAVIFCRVGNAHHNLLHQWWAMPTLHIVTSLRDFYKITASECACYKDSA